MPKGWALKFPAGTADKGGEAAMFEISDEELEALKIVLENISAMTCVDEVIDGLSDDQQNSFFDLIERFTMKEES